MAATSSRSLPPRASDAHQLVVLALPEGAREKRALTQLARLLSLPLDDARRLVTSLPAPLPKVVSPSLAAAWRSALEPEGVAAEVRPCAVPVRCQLHPDHASVQRCAECDIELCALCQRSSGSVALCGPCFERRRARRRFYHARVAVLSAILLAVLAYAARDYQRRHARGAWERPLRVALILLEKSPVDPAAFAAFEAGIDRLEDALAREFRRYGGTFEPFSFEAFGPVPEPVVPPLAPVAPSIFDALTFSLSLGKFARTCDAAVGLEGSYDGKIYVRLSAPQSTERAFVEGSSEDGGVIAVTNIELGEHSADFGLFVISHELMHLLGARDRYAPDGTTLIPEGLGEPDQDPLYPQLTAEIMAHGRVLAPGREVAPGHLDELRVGASTAREIGWLEPDAQR